MPRKARLFASSSGSAARGFLKFRANIPPRWIKNAQTSRKRIEPEIVEALHSMISIKALKNVKEEADIRAKILEAGIKITVVETRDDRSTDDQS
jgi:hypothetical protein